MLDLQTTDVEISIKSNGNASNRQDIEPQKNGYNNICHEVLPLVTPEVATTIIKPNPIELHEPYVVYSRRWWMLATVVLLNLANYSHWVAFASISKTAALFYDQSGQLMDLIPTLSYGLGIPCCILATIVVELKGLKNSIQIGGYLTGIGGLLCFVSTCPYVSDLFSSFQKYLLALIGQALTGIACPFITCVPTKISQGWFNNNQRILATIILGMANPMGIVLGQGLTPLLVQKDSDVPIMNTIWFIPATVGCILTIFKVKSSNPPTPPSPSAAASIQSSVTKYNSWKVLVIRKYWPSIKEMIFNKSFMILTLFIGGAMGYVSTISTKIEQILCAKGYSDQLAGLSGSLILLCGFITSFPIGFLASKTSRSIGICKASCCFVIIALLGLAYYMRNTNANYQIVLACSCLGIFALGCYPIGLELVVECTYPLDQATTTAFIFFSSAIQGVALMTIENFLVSPLTSAEDLSIQTCVDFDDPGHQQPMDYSIYLNVITSYMIFLSIIFIFFFNTDLKRTNMDKINVAAKISNFTDAEANINDQELEQEQKETKMVNQIGNL